MVTGCAFVLPWIMEPALWRKITTHFFVMITEKHPVQRWPLDDDEMLRRSEGRTVLVTVLLLSTIVAMSFYALSRPGEGPAKDLPKAERATGPAAP
jgi:hypothetical protein